VIIGLIQPILYLALMGPLLNSLPVAELGTTGNAYRFFVPGLQRFEIPDSSGIFGGLVGAQNQQVLVRESDVRLRFADGQIPDFDELAGEYVLTGDLPRSVALTEREVLKTISETGGGWGDPLEREPGAIQADLDVEAITREAAERLYGVELTGESRVDPVATLERREAIRDVVFSGTAARTAVYAGEMLPAGVTIPGPAIAEFPGTTVVVGPAQQAVPDGDGHIFLSPAESAAWTASAR